MAVARAEQVVDSKTIVPGRVLDPVWLQFSGSLRRDTPRLRAFEKGGGTLTIRSYTNTYTIANYSALAETLYFNGIYPDRLFTGYQRSSAISSSFRWITEHELNHDAVEKSAAYRKLVDELVKSDPRFTGSAVQVVMRLLEEHGRPSAVKMYAPQHVFLMQQIQKMAAEAYKKEHEAAADIPLLTSMGYQAFVDKMALSIAAGITLDSLFRITPESVAAFSHRWVDGHLRSRGRRLWNDAAFLSRLERISPEASEMARRASLPENKDIANDVVVSAMPMMELLRA